MQATEKLSDRLANLLLQAVESGALKPNDRLPTEQELSAQHGVSRTVVREAVSRLKSMGVLVSRQGSGVYVSKHGDVKHLNFDPAVLQSLASVLQVVEVRRALEGEVAALAAERAGKRDVQRIQAALTAIDKAVDEGRDGVDEDLQFHRAIAQAAGNPQFAHFLGFIEQYVRDAMRVTRRNEAGRADFSEAVRREHRNIVKAIADGNP